MPTICQSVSPGTTAPGSVGTDTSQTSSCSWQTPGQKPGSLPLKKTFEPQIPLATGSINENPLVPLPENHLAPSAENAVAPFGEN